MSLYQPRMSWNARTTHSSQYVMGLRRNPHPPHANTNHVGLTPDLSLGIEARTSNLNPLQCLLSYRSSCTNINYSFFFFFYLSSRKPLLKNMFALYGLSTISLGK
jgi:hypothetical protein